MDERVGEWIHKARVANRRYRKARNEARRQRVRAEAAETRARLAEAALSRCGGQRPDLDLPLGDWRDESVDGAIQRQREPMRIEVGQLYIWEPSKPHAMQVVRVSRIVVMENGDVRVYTTTTDGKNETWNDADRFQEACTYAKA